MDFVEQQVIGADLHDITIRVGDGIPHGQDGIQTDRRHMNEFRRGKFVADGWG